ncbi:hypothetical protein [Capnocytophaga sp.]|uniref:hypothetical protein n=1 Tax=Capnocytophaga sp. TaxID=44737 RepID=UPI0026DD10B7|nr:hypothetical protein [Capnocytophaga sp.]MDO5106598.1 hypothetical protein [Capnocytophaga sp.]
MNLQDVAYVNSLVLGARFEAFETFFWEWLKTAIPEKQAIEQRMIFLDLFRQNLDDYLKSFPNTPQAERIRSALQNAQAETQRNLTFLHQELQNK